MYVFFGMRRGPHIVRPSRPHKFLLLSTFSARTSLNKINIKWLNYLQYSICITQRLDQICALIKVVYVTANVNYILLN